MPLPEGWEMKIDANSNQTYFVNHTAQSTTWNDPRIRKNALSFLIHTFFSLLAANLQQAAQEIAMAEQQQWHPQMVVFSLRIHLDKLRAFQIPQDYSNYTHNNSQIGQLTNERTAMQHRQAVLLEQVLMWRLQHQLTFPPQNLISPMDMTRHDSAYGEDFIPHVAMSQDQYMQPPTTMYSAMQ